MEKQKINAVEFIREIRDEHYRQLIGKSNKERIDFFQQRAQNMLRKIPIIIKDQNHQIKTKTPD